MLFALPAILLLCFRSIARPLSPAVYLLFCNSLFLSFSDPVNPTAATDAAAGGSRDQWNVREDCSVLYVSLQAKSERESFKIKADSFLPLNSCRHDFVVIASNPLKSCRPLFASITLKPSVTVSDEAISHLSRLLPKVYPLDSGIGIVSSSLESYHGENIPMYTL